LKKVVITFLVCAALLAVAPMAHSRTLSTQPLGRLDPDFVAGQASAQAPALPERQAATGGIVNPDITGYH
jgi:hypothetical protein